MHRHRDAMLRDLAEWILACRPYTQFARLERLKLPWKAWERALAQAGFQLSCALYLIAQHRTSHKQAASRSGAALSDITYAQGLLKRADVSVHEMVARQHPIIETEVVAQTEEMIVRLDNRAFEDILLAVAEGYLPKRGSSFTEVFGLCFGSVRTVPTSKLGKKLQINVGRVTTQMRARATSNQVEPNWRSFERHLSIADKFFPHLEIVGDYHSHPYRTFEYLQKARGWEYSQRDEDSLEYINEKITERRSLPLFSLVVAVAQGERSGNNAIRRRPNVIQVPVDDLFFVVAAYRIRRDATYDGSVTLHLPALV